MRMIANAMESDNSFRHRILQSGILTTERCTEEENEQYLALDKAGAALPDEIITSEEYSTKFERIVPSDLSAEEELNLIEYLKLKEIAKIRGWVAFFGILTIIGLICGLLTVLLPLLK